jgi:hypothetical protein
MRQSLPEKQLTALLTQAEAANSDAVAIMHNSKLLNLESEDENNSFG